jgi:hypothetical protein
VTILLQLQRHGARYPTSGASVGIKLAVSKLQSVTNFTDPQIAFMNTYKYELGEDDLVAFGAQECVQFRLLCDKGPYQEPGLSNLEKCTMIGIPI